MCKGINSPTWFFLPFSFQRVPKRAVLSLDHNPHRALHRHDEVGQDPGAPLGTPFARSCTGNFPPPFRYFQSVANFINIKSCLRSSFLFLHFSFKLFLSLTPTHLTRMLVPGVMSGAPASDQTTITLACTADCIASVRWTSLFVALHGDYPGAVIHIKHTHTTPQAYREMLQSLNTLQKFQDDKAKDLFAMLQNNVFYVLEYREVILHLLINYNENDSTRWVWGCAEEL